MSEMGDLTDDAVLGGRLRLLQPARGHRAGSDAVLLASAVPAGDGEHVLDFGAGVGTAGLAVLERVGGTCATLVEIAPDLAELARSNAERNGMAERVRVLTSDVCRLVADGVVPPDRADHVLMNPPFHDPHGRRSPDPATARARMAEVGLLDLWCRSAAGVLKPGGSLTLIHRPDALDEILQATARRFGGVWLRFVHPDPARPAVRVLLAGIKGSKAPLRVLPPLMLQGGDGRFSEEAEALHRGAGMRA
jgi:tRNA1(Val) A37 N6-methylase TrmN6